MNVRDINDRRHRAACRHLGASILLEGIIEELLQRLFVVLDARLGALAVKFSLANVCGNELADSLMIAAGLEQLISVPVAHEFVQK